jgi:hypothetical protein
LNARRILAGVFLLIAGIAAYMTWLCWREGNDGKWLFGVFTMFFLLLGAAPLMPKASHKSQPEPATSTRFVPHWFMMLAVLVLLLTFILGIVGALRR